MRYAGWIKDLSPAGTPHELTDIGRQLLGYLDNQRRWSKVKSQSITIKTPDGSVVHAEFRMGQPIIQCVPAPPGPPVEAPRTIEGFVTRPQPIPGGMGDVDTWVLLDPLTSKWQSYFYQKSDLPIAPTWRTGVYRNDSVGRPLFLDGTLHKDAGTGLPIPPHMDGLQNFGNVDWRNKDESLIVSWVGPAARYDTTGFISTYFSPYVFIHGQQVFDCSVLATGGFFGDMSDYPADYGGQKGVITGACLAAGSLFVVIRFGTLNVTGLTTHPRRTEYLVRLSLVSADPRSVVLPLASVWALKRAVDPGTIATSADHYDGAPLVVWSREYDTGLQLDNDNAHPWFFNQSATEARCIRTTAGITDTYEVREHVLTLNPDRTSATFDTTVHAAGSYTEDSSSNNYTGTDLFHVDDGTGNTYFPDWRGPTGQPRPAATCWLGYSTGTSSTDTKTQSVPWQIAYVDYRDDVVVYGSIRNPEFSSSGSSSFGPLTGSVSVVVAGSDKTTTYAFATALTTTSSTAGVNAGLQTDWMEVVANHTVSNNASGLSSTSGVDTEHQFLVSGVMHQTNTLDATMTAQGNTTNHEEIEGFNLVWLDLRYKWLVYQLTKETIDTVSDFPSQTATFSDTQTGVGSPPGYRNFDFIALSPTKTAVWTADTVVTLNGDELARETVHTAPDSVVTGAGSGLPAFFSWAMNYECWWLIPTITPCFSSGALHIVSIPAGTLVPDAGGCVAGSTAAVTTHTTGTTIPVMNVGMDPSSSVWSIKNATVGDTRAPCTFGLYGSWQTYKTSPARPRYAFSQAMPSGSDPTVENYSVKASTDQDLALLTNRAGLTYMHPIWVLPKVTY